MTAPLAPGAVIGILGAGQLGMMAAVAARQLGYRTWVYSSAPEAPAIAVADRAIVASWDDESALSEFGAACGVATSEFENVPSRVFEILESEVPLRPRRGIFEIASDRRQEKTRLAELGAPVAPFAIIEARDDLDRLPAEWSWPGVLKTARFGYDGKGQQRVAGPAQLAPAWEELGRLPCVLETFVEFDCELSVIVARSPGGETATYGPMLNRHENHILDLTLHPAGVPVGVRKEACDMARDLSRHLGLEGLLCIELFLLPGGRLLINELAPRPHNSGHWTLDGCRTSQFEQLVRAVCGQPLGSTKAAPLTGMLNLLGDRWENGTPRFARALGDPDIKLHLYGKREARKGRKMGHLNLVGDEAPEVERRLREARGRM